MAERVRDKPGDPADIASYVATMSGDLALMARRHGLDTLGYLLEMARLEAQNASVNLETTDHD